MEGFERLCRSRKVPLTRQRRLILETLLLLGTHPTTEEVHDAVARRDRRVSRTTVYRTLETLAGLGVIRRTSHPGRGFRYDHRTDRHHHLVCVRCGEVADFSDGALDAIPLPDVSARGFEVSELSVQLRGLCRRCRKKEKKP